MADKTVVGGPPPADLSGYPPGSAWIWVKQIGTDANGMTFKVNIYSNSLANQIEYGDGTVFNPVAWEYAPSGGAPGLALSPNKVYTGRPGTMYRIMAEAGGVRLRGTVTAGLPAVVDDVSRDGVERPPVETQTDVFRERSKLAVSVRRQMGAMPPIEGGRVN